MGCFLFTSANAVCLDINIISHPCRYSKGDSWCIDNNLSPYAYNSKCLNNMAPMPDKINESDRLIDKNSSEHVQQDGKYNLYPQSGDKNYHNFANLIKEKIYKNWIPPAQITGSPSAVISLRLTHGGIIDSRAVSIVASSGIASFDQSILSAIYKSSPLPVPSGSDFDNFRILNLKFALPGTAVAPPVATSATEKEIYNGLKDAQTPNSPHDALITKSQIKNNVTESKQHSPANEIKEANIFKIDSFWFIFTLICAVVAISLYFYKVQGDYKIKLDSLSDGLVNDSLDYQPDRPRQYKKIALDLTSLADLKKLEDTLTELTKTRLDLINSLNRLDQESENHKKRIRRITYVPFGKAIFNKSYTLAAKRLREIITNSYEARIKYEDCKVQLDVILTQTQKDNYLHLSNAFKKLSNCERIEEVIGVVNIDKISIRSSADTLINTRPTRFLVDELTKNDLIISEYNPLRMKGIDDTDILIYPFFSVLDHDNGDLEIIRMKDLNIEIMPVEFVEEREIPGDAEVINSTWKYVNINGTRDFRFSNNYEIPIVRYARLGFSANNGFNRYYQISNYRATCEFLYAYSFHVNGLEEVLCSNKAKNSRKTSSMTHDKACEILGVKINATKEEIQNAYRTMIKKYHPDKVASLGGEFSEIAEKKTTEINLAYQMLS